MDDNIIKLLRNVNDGLQAEHLQGRLSHIVAQWNIHESNGTIAKDLINWINEGGKMATKEQREIEKDLIDFLTDVALDLQVMEFKTPMDRNDYAMKEIYGWLNYMMTDIDEARSIHEQMIKDMDVPSTDASHDLPPKPKMQHIDFNDNEKSVYVVLEAVPWNGLKFPPITIGNDQEGNPVEVSIQPKFAHSGKYFLRVYESIEEAEKDHPGKQVMVMKVPQGILSA